MHIAHTRTHTRGRLQGGLTALLTAAAAGRGNAVGTVSALLSAGADVEAKDKVSGARWGWGHIGITFMEWEVGAGGAWLAAPACTHPPYAAGCGLVELCQRHAGCGVCRVRRALRPP